MNLQAFEQQLNQAQSAKEMMTRELSRINLQADDDKKKLENNMQVITWLNKQINEGGRAGISSSLPTPAVRAPLPIPAIRSTLPTPNTNNSVSNNLSRYLPNHQLASTPYNIQQQYVTPDHNTAVPITSAGATRRLGLHPEPTPFDTSGGATRWMSVPNPAAIPRRP